MSDKRRPGVLVRLDPDEIAVLDDLVDRTGMTRPDLIRAGLVNLSVEAARAQRPEWSNGR